MQAAVETHSFIHIGRFRQVKVLQLSRDWEASLFAHRFVSRHYSAEWTGFVLDSSSAKYFTRECACLYYYYRPGKSFLALRMDTFFNLACTTWT